MAVPLGRGILGKTAPLHLCGLQIFFIPLAVFTRHPALRSYVWATSILGGITAIVYPAGIVGTYPFFHFQTLQSFALHLLLILAPLLMFLTDDDSPRLNQLPSVILILSGSALCAFAVDWIWGQNYMFLREVPQIAFLQAIKNWGGYPAYWLTLAAAGHRRMRSSACSGRTMGIGKKLESSAVEKIPAFSAL